jgi:hypothetical protein
MEKISEVVCWIAVGILGLFYGRVDVDTRTWFSRGVSLAVCPFLTSLVDSDTCRDSFSRGICLSVQT